MRNVRSILLLRWIMPALLVAGAAAAWVPPAADPPAAIRFDLPLAEGKLQVRDLLETLSGELGVPPGPALSRVDWVIDVESTLGSIQLAVLNRIADGAIRTRVADGTIEVVVDRQKIRRTVDAAGTTVQEWLDGFIVRVPDAQQRPFGLTFVGRGEPRTLDERVEAGDLPPRIVLLVHGLDDPGWMWRDVIPALTREGHDVARLDYPNDGPIAEAADLLAATLRDLRSAGVERVDLVAHSMGGLVSRDVLTRRVYYDGDGSGTEALPAIDRLIMVGTPNHGSVMARLRGISELREQISRLIDGDGWIGAVDGAGEAGVDLLPDSDFLRRLNTRPLASHTRHSIIAARISPLSEATTTAFIDRVAELARSEQAPDWLREMARSPNGRAARVLAGNAVRGLGDGCVSIDSARLEGVDDFQVVNANHLSVIVRLLETEDTPPAIPLILERLSRPLE